MQTLKRSALLVFVILAGFLAGRLTAPGTARAQAGNHTKIHITRIAPFSSFKQPHDVPGEPINMSCSGNMCFVLSVEK